MDPTYAQDFGPFEGKAWINSAHQGAIPRIAAEAAREAIAWKVAPYHMTTERFSEVPARLREVLGRLIGAPADDVIVANSNSYGLHLLANGIPWKEGDEVLVMKGDFPSDILPWLGLAPRGVVVRRITPRQIVLQPDEVAAHISPSTRVLCTTWVHSFSGKAIDVQGIGAVCREHGVKFILNGSQAIGTRPFHVGEMPVDALTSVGFKWLCGPYGTGFCWIRPDLRETLQYNQAYWLSQQTADDLGKAQEARIKSGLGARKYDIFGTANFFNFKPWTASISYLLAQGIGAIRDYNDALVSRLIEGLDPDRYTLLSPRSGPARSTLVILSHHDCDRNASVFEALRRNEIYVSYRQGNLRFAPHLYNTTDEIDRALAVLNGYDNRSA